MAIFGIGNIAKIAGLAIAGLVGYTLIKNAGNIGSQVGSFAGTGLRNLGSGITEGFSTTFDIFGGSPNADTGGAISQDDPNTFITETTNPEDALVDPIGFVPIANPFKSFVTSGTISRGFAEKYSAQPPALQGQLDVSKTFAYIDSPTYRANQQSSNVGRLGDAQYGGFGSSKSQTDALASAIESSATAYPEWFA
tara:strand:+ start:1047 stop:1631 length:585 start_codon:yes stop_codon:yes gene_type:complete